MHTYCNFYDLIYHALPILLYDHLLSIKLTKSTNKKIYSAWWKLTLYYFADNNECEEGSDNCHDTLEKCINTDGSYRCMCNDGYTGGGVGVDSCQSKCME